MTWLVPETSLRLESQLETNLQITFFWDFCASNIILLHLMALVRRSQTKLSELELHVHHTGCPSISPVNTSENKERDREDVL